MSREEKEREQHLAYKALIQALPDVLYELDSSGRFVFISDGIKMFGYEPERLVGRHFGDIIHPEDMDKVDLDKLMDEYRGKVTGDRYAPKVFNERRTKARMTRNLELRIVSEEYKTSLDEEQSIKRDCYYVEVHSTGLWDRDTGSIHKAYIGPIGIFRNISHRKALEKSLRDKRDKLESLVQNDPDGILIVNKEDNKIQFMNPSAEKILGAGKEQLIGKEFYFPLEPGESNEYEIEYPTGYKMIVEVVAMEMSTDKEGSYIVSMRDETKNVLTRETFQEQALVDELTRVNNRRGFLLLAAHQLKASSRRNEDVCLVFLDVDNMKEINDKLGHDKGDQALINVATALKQAFRETDIIGRLGGDEFAVLSSATIAKNPETFKGRIKEALNIISLYGVIDYQVGVSIGIKYCDAGECVSIERLLEEADKDMYIEKRKKKQ